jgi:glycosyltransferase involved in cell wall biosynthesis
MADAMTRLAADRSLVSRLGAQARTFAETFTWERAAEETERHLQQVITSRRVS